MSPRREQQQAFDFTNWGGRRRGAGRKPQGEQACVPHKKRAPLRRYEPVHVTVKLERGLPSLRGALAFHAVRRALVCGCERFGFRLVHWSIQSNHAHLIAEVEDKSALTRGMKGLCVRIAQALNALWRRSGRVFADRFHAHALETPTEVRNALRRPAVRRRLRPVQLGRCVRRLAGSSRVRPIELGVRPRTHVAPHQGLAQARADPAERRTSTGKPMNAADLRSAAGVTTERPAPHAHPASRRPVAPRARRALPGEPTSPRRAPSPSPACTSRCARGR